MRVSRARSNDLAVGELKILTVLAQAADKSYCVKTTYNRLSRATLVPATTCHFIMQKLVEKGVLSATADRTGITVFLKQ